MKQIFFDYLCTIHVLIWIVVLFAFVDFQLAKLNFYYIIPIIYIIHILPFHILVESKKNIYKNNYHEKEDDFFNSSFIGYIIKFQKLLEKKCFASPLSAQGMLILGALTSGYSILYNSNIPLFKL